MRLYPSITVDLYKPYPLVVLDVPQNNIGRGAMVTLTAGGAVVIPENETVEVYAKKPDGTKVYNTVIVAGNQLQVAFSPQMTAVEGILQAELQMIDSTGNSITTPIFAVRILKSNIDANAIVSQDDFQALVDALAEVEEIKSTIQKGDPGEAATIQIGTVTASDPGSNPQVNNSGTEQDAVFDFVFPRGDPGSMWYQGDAITGTSTSGTVFTGSGVENAELNDMYLNTGSGADKGNIYVCVLAGPASTAQWAYKQNIMGPTGPAGTANASSVAYDNESSGMTATNVQGAVDELNQKMEWKFMGSGNAIQIPAGAKDINVCVTFEPGQVASSVIPNRNQRVDFGFYYTPSANGSACVNIANSVLTLVQAFNGGKDAKTTVQMNAYYR